MITVMLCDGVSRVRHGHVHVLNNFYEGWGMYAIGGSEEPTIVSQGNVFTAPNGVNKEVSTGAGLIAGP
jgi:pectate lyase